MFDKLKSTISKIKGAIGLGISSDIVADVEEMLLGAGISPSIAYEVAQKLSSLGRNASQDDALALIKDELRNLLATDSSPLLFACDDSLCDSAPSALSSMHRPFVIMLVGVNGNGKTSTAAKLAAYFSRHNKSVRLVACDTFRAAATEQLEFWARSTSCTITTGAEGQDPASVAYTGLSDALMHHEDIVIVDTAGRLHNNTNLMNELTRIKQVMKKVIPDAPHACVLVLDTLTGHTLMTQSNVFIQQMGADYIILTKMDSNAKAGAIFSIKRGYNIPICAITTGESIGDLHAFDPDAFLERIFADV